MNFQFMVSDYVLVNIPDSKAGLSPPHRPE